MNGWFTNNIMHGYIVASKTIDRESKPIIGLAAQNRKSYIRQNVDKISYIAILSKYDFWYNMRKQNDGALACMLSNGIEDKRVSYQDSSSVAFERVR